MKNLDEKSKSHDSEKFEKKVDVGQIGRTLVIQANSAGLEKAGRMAAEIRVDGIKVDMAKNENGHFRGIHIAIINADGKSMISRVFDTHTSSEQFEIFI